MAHVNSCIVASGSLYGTTLAQTIFYFLSFPADSKITKHLVSAMYVPGVFLTTDTGSGFHPLVEHSRSARSCYSPDTLHYFCFVSILDSVHVVLICDWYWDLLVRGRPLQEPGLKMLPWSVLHFLASSD
jgi:hypothetical protein